MQVTDIIYVCLLPDILQGICYIPVYTCQNWVWIGPELGLNWTDAASIGPMQAQFWSIITHATTWEEYPRLFDALGQYHIWINDDTVASTGVLS